MNAYNAVVIRYKSVQRIYISVSLQMYQSCDPNTIDYKGRTALNIAIRNNHEDVVEFLLTRNDICLRDAELVAVEDGNVGLLEKLLDWRETYSLFSTSSYDPQLPISCHVVMLRYLVFLETLGVVAVGLSLWINQSVRHCMVYTRSGVPKLWSAALRWSAGRFEVVPRDNTLPMLVV